MSSRGTPIRERIGQVSLFQHHGAWYTYHRHRGRAFRLHWGAQYARAQVAASLLNAALVAAADHVVIDTAITDALTHAGGGALVHILVAEPANRGNAGLACTTTIPALRRAFLEHHEKVLGSAVATVSRYAAATAHLETFARRIPGMTATNLDAPAFVEFLRTLDVASNGHPNTARRRLRDRGVRYVLETCRSLYRFGAAKLLPKDFANPFTALGIGRFRVRDRRPVFVFDPAQELAFLQAADPWGFAVHFTLAKTGLRPGELVHLLVEDVDLARGWLHVVSKAELGWTIKTGRERQVPLVPEVVAVLTCVIRSRKAGPIFLRTSLWPMGTPAVAGNRRALAQLAQERLASARARAEQALTRFHESRILAGLWRDAGATEEDRIRSSFMRIAKRAGLEATCPKSWRHTFATLLQQANVEVLVRQITLGHKPSNPEDSVLGMTAHYTHTTPELQRQEIEKAMRLRPESLELARSWLERHGKHKEVDHEQ